MPTRVSSVNNTNGLYATYNMLDQIRRFCAGFGDGLTSSYAGTGDGALTNLDSTVNSITETWTLTCTATAVNGGTFSVVGSVSGAQASATVGVAYSNTFLSFTIADGAIDFALGDAFTVNITQGALAAINRRWTILRYDTSIAERELIMMAPGLDGAQQIYCGVKCYQDVGADYYNLAVAGMRGYVAGNTFATQPGISGVFGIPGHNVAINYWLRVNGQSLNCVMKVGTPVYESFGVGRFFQSGLPSQYPQPLFVSAPLTSQAATRYSDTVHSFGWKGNRANLKMNFNDGTWKQPLVHPFATTLLANQVRPTGATYSVKPLELYDATNKYGYLDGMFHITGFDNVVENTLVIDGKTYLVVQDVGRTGFGDYVAMILD